MPVRFKLTQGFSLFEVVIAVGIFAVAITIMVGLLPSLTRQSNTAVEMQTALRLPDAARAELARVAASGSFDALAAQVSTLSSPIPGTLELVATRDAEIVQSLAYQPPAVGERIGAENQYFLIEAWKFGDPPLAYDNGGASLLLHVRVSWPYHLPNSPSVTPLVSREQIIFNLALQR